MLVLTLLLDIDNFSDAAADHTQSIQSESKIYTATGDGEIPPVAASDIAAVAVEVLTSKELLKGARYPIYGPEKLSFEQVRLPV